MFVAAALVGGVTRALDRIARGVAALALAACGAARPLPTPAPPITVEVPAVESLPLPYDGLGVHIRSGELEGLAYAEVVLGEVEEGTPLPLVVALHGVGDAPRFPSGALLRTGIPMRLVLPRAPHPYAGAFAWSTHRVRENVPEALAADLVAAADRVAALTAELARLRPTIGPPIVTGFSQGAMVAWFAALRHPDAFGVALIAAGWMRLDLAGAAGCGPPTHVVHGLADRIVVIDGAREAVNALAARGCDVELVEMPRSEHAIDAAMNDVIEGWLEEALAERAPEPSGGVGERGPDPAPYVEVASPLLELTAP